MRTVNQATQDAWSEISYTKKRIYLPGLSESIENDYIGSIKMKEAISDDENLFFVGCISTKIDIILNNYTQTIDDEEIEIYVQKGNTDELKVFTGKIYHTEIDGSNNTMKVVCYDAMYEIFNADVTGWYDGLSLPMSMASFRASFFSYFNITEKSASLINDSYLVERTIGGEEILGRDIIKPLCEANAILGHINYDGEMEYLFPTSEEREVELGEVSSMTKEDFTTSLIDKVIVRTDEQDIGAVAGVGSNAYIVEGNMFFLGLSAEELQTIAETILSAIESISYRPVESEQMYNPIYELGDLITVPDGFGNEYTTIILERETDLDREVTSAKGLVEYSRAASYSNDSLIALKGKTNRLYRDVEQTRSEIQDVDAGLRTLIRQTAEGIEVQIEDLQDQIDGAINYYEREGTPTLLNYPYWDFTTAFKSDGTKRCADIYNDDMTEGGEQYPHFYYSETDRRNHQRDLVFDTLNAVSYRFNLVDGQWIWQEIADSETSIILSRISSLEATAESLQTEYTELSLDLSGNYYTKVQTESRITQTASQIQTTVSQTYATKTTTTNLQSQITQQATQISAKVSETGGNNSSFGWYLKSDKFELKSGNRTVFLCNSSGIRVDGLAVASEINSVKARVGSLEADHVTVGQLNAVSARVGSLEADHVTVAQLNAVNGRFNSLNASNITAGTLSVDRLNVQSIADRFQSVRFACVAISASSAGTFANLSIYHSGVSRYATLYCDTNGYVKWR